MLQFQSYLVLMCATKCPRIKTDSIFVDMNLMQFLIVLLCITVGWTKEELTEVSSRSVFQKHNWSSRRKTLDLSCKMCSICLRSRSCDFYVKLKRTCRTLISLPLVCNNGTSERIGFKIEVSKSRNSVSVPRIFIGNDFVFLKVLKSKKWS